MSPFQIYFMSIIVSLIAALLYVCVVEDDKPKNDFIGGGWLTCFIPGVNTIVAVLCTIVVIAALFFGRK